MTDQAVPLEERLCKVLRDRMDDLKVSQRALGKRMERELKDHVWDQPRVYKMLWREIPNRLEYFEVAANALGLSFGELVTLADEGLITQYKLTPAEASILEIARGQGAKFVECLQGVLAPHLQAPSADRRQRPRPAAVKRTTRRIS